jgi:hypothetical protein
MKSISAAALFFTICLITAQSALAQNWMGNGIKGEGSKVTKTLNLDKFDAVGLAISADVFLTQGNSQSVKIEAQNNIIENLVTDVENGRWKIKFDKNVREHDGIKIWITIPTLKEASVSGSGDIVGESSFNGLDLLNLAVSGSGSIRLDYQANRSEAAISGSGDMKLSGSVSEIAIRVSGSGDVDAFDLTTKSCSVRISGSGDVSVHPDDYLDAAIAGSGDVYYKGQPKVKSKISGSGDVVAK